MKKRFVVYVPFSHDSKITTKITIVMAENEEIAIQKAVAALGEVGYCCSLVDVNECKADVLVCKEVVIL